jgi:hypothetical protein
MQVFLVLVAIATGAGVAATGLVSMDGPNPWTNSGVNAQQPPSRSNPSSFKANAGAGGAFEHVAAHRGHPQPHEGCPRPQICVPQQEMGDAPTKYVWGRRSVELMKPKRMSQACPECGASGEFVVGREDEEGRASMRGAGGTVCPRTPEIRANVSDHTHTSLSLTRISKGCNGHQNDGGRASTPKRWSHIGGNTRRRRRLRSTRGHRLVPSRRETRVVHKQPTRRKGG